VTHVASRSAAETVEIPPHLLVLFGGTGDLAVRKLLPAVAGLLERRRFADRLQVLAVATRPLDDDGYRRFLEEGLKESGLSEACLKDLLGRVSYHRVGDGFDVLARRIEAIEAAGDLEGNRVFYLAVPPAVFDDTIDGLVSAGLDRSPGTTRVVVEKPFGTDLDSAIRLNRTLHRHFPEEEIYRIDHYLAKETVQNLLVFRFANPLFESAWNRDRIDRVEVTVAETLGLEGRVKYFDEAGIIRDIVQNHLLQVLALVAMEPPVRLTARHIRDEKVKLLEAVFPVMPHSVTRGQYSAGAVDGVTVPGYLGEEGVDPASTTETFARLTLDIDNWRWRGVPFVLTAGKRMERRMTEVVVSFREPPVCLFEVNGVCPVHPNRLVITLQPNEGFDLYFDVKRPGEGMALETKTLSFRYGDEFGQFPDAYETLLVDVLTGDQTLFVRADEAEEAWRIVAGVVDLTQPPTPYPAGSKGPFAATANNRLTPLWPAP
jgi:glucose-6-phosphate 1-dehydrogenase